MAFVATAVAPWTSVTSPGRVVPPSDRRVTSGSRTFEQALEVAVARGSEEGVNDRPLTVEVGIRDRGALDPAAAAAGELAGRGARFDRRSARCRRTGWAKTSWRTNATRSAGESDSRTARSARPIESPSIASCSGSAPVTGNRRSDPATCGSRGASRRVLRERSVFRHTRPTTVVSQARMFSTSLASVRLSRIHDFWTASSASLSEPSIR